MCLLLGFLLFEEEIAAHSSILGLKILWTEEPDRLQSMESQSQTQLSNGHYCYYYFILL